MKLPGPHPSRALPLLAAAAIVLLSAGPGAAATSVANAEATGLVLTVASTPTDSGTYAVMNDGTGETSSGTNRPLITALGKQGAISAGTLAQDATTTIRDGRGLSAACAGLAGDGATLVAAGDGGCLTPGDQVRLSAGTLDLTGVTIARGDLLAGADDQVQAAVQPLLDQVLPRLQSGLQRVLRAAGGALFLDAGAIQSNCTASPGQARGDSALADVGLRGALGGNRVDVVDLPVSPPPNTKVATDLTAVVKTVQKALRAQFKSTLDGRLGQVALVTDAVINQINDQLIAQVAPQLAPLEDNILDITLNKQVRPARGVIEVTALDAQVVPAAKAFGVDLVAAEIGKTRCGPSGRVTTTPTSTPSGPAVPTAVPAGESMPVARADDGALNSLLAAGALTALGGVALLAGVTVYRRRTAR